MPQTRPALGDARKGGYHLKIKRNERQMTQREVDRATDGMVSAQELSKLEQGGTAHPPMDSLVALGEVYGLTPNEIAQMYDYWQPKEMSEEERQLDFIRHVLGELEPYDKVRLLDLLESAAKTVQAQALAKQREKALQEA